MMHIPTRVIAILFLLPPLPAHAAVQAPAVAAEPDPGGPWIEQFAWHERVHGRAPDDGEHADILRAGGAPRLAVLRARIGSRAQIAEADADELLRAVVEEAQRSARRLALATAAPDAAQQSERAAWHLLRGEDDAALALVAGLPADDVGADANLLRLLAALASSSVTDALVEAHVRTRASLHGPLAALAFDADRALLELAASELRLEDESRYGGAGQDDGSGGERDPYTPPAWVHGEFPPDDVAAAITRRDATASAALVAEARGLPESLTDRDARALEILARARAADVLSPEPCFETAWIRNGRREFAQALEEVDAGLRRQPGDARGWAMRAATCDALGDLRGTLLSAERALELDPADPALETRYIGALVQLGHLGEALVAARDVVVENPWNAWARIAFALDRCDGHEILAGADDARLVARFLADSDERARLWAAVTLGAVRRSLEGAPRAVLTSLLEAHGTAPIGAAARGVLDDDPGTALWGGFGRLARGDRAGALERWHADAAKHGDAAIAARGLVAHFDRRSEWATMPALPEFTAEDVPELPDPSAIAVRVPGEARTLEVALARLPDGARRIVVARGAHVAPRAISRSVDVFGADFESVVTTDTGKDGTITVAIPAGELRLFELRLDARLVVLDGDVVARRVDATGSIAHGLYQQDAGTVTAWYEDVTFRDRVTFAMSRGEGRFDRCTWSFPYGSGGALSVYRSRAALHGCTLQQNQSSEPPIQVHEADARVRLEDCRIAGLPGSDGALQPVVVATNGGGAQIVRTRIVDLEPVASSRVVAEDSTFQRTVLARGDPPGWKAAGHAAEPRRTESGEVRVPGDYPTLAAALVALEPGRTIRVSAGIHPVSGPITRDVVLVGENTNRTVIQPAADGGPLEIRGAHVTLRDLRLAGHGLPLYQNGLEYDVDSGVRTDTRERPPPLARVLDGELHFGPNVNARDPRGMRFEIGPGGAVTGAIGVWMRNSVPTAEVTADGILAVAIDHHLRRWVEVGVDWSAPPPDDRGSAHRPLASAIDRRALERELESRALRLARLDAALARGWPAGGTEFLIDAARSVWSLAPEGQRDQEMYARLDPRLATLARRDARRHVEDLIAIVLAGVGDSRTIEAVFATASHLAGTYRDNTPEDQRTYVDARLAGMSAAQADVAARREQCLAALDAGRATEALALAEGLDPLTRAHVLVTTRPDRLRYDEIDALLREGASGELERRLRILKLSKGSLRPTGPPALPGFWQLVHLYSDADRTGVANQYFAFRDKDGPRGWTSETVLRPEYVAAATAGAGDAMPKQPAPGASRAEWDRYYVELEAWVR